MVRYGAVLAKTEKIPLASKLYLRLFGLPFLGEDMRFSSAVRILEPKPDENILDVGCAGGVISLELVSSFGCAVYGVDLNIGSIDNARKRAGAIGYPKDRFSVGDATSLEFEDRTFDKVMCLDVIEHIEDDRKVMAEIFRVMKDGGKAVISTPFKHAKVEHCPIVEGVPSSIDGHVRQGYTLEELEGLVKGAGGRIGDSISYGRFFSRNAERISMLFYRGIGREKIQRPGWYGTFGMREKALAAAMAVLYPLLWLSSRLDFLSSSTGDALMILVKKGDER